MLDWIDEFLATAAERIDRTRKGRAWDVWVDGRPVYVAVLERERMIELSAGCNAPEDYAILRRLAKGIAEIAGGQASEPVK